MTPGATGLFIAHCVVGRRPTKVMRKRIGVGGLATLLAVVAFSASGAVTGAAAGHVLSSGVRETDAIRASFDSFTLLR